MTLEIAIEALGLITAICGWVYVLASTFNARKKDYGEAIYNLLFGVFLVALPLITN